MGPAIDQERWGPARARAGYPRVDDAQPCLMTFDLADFSPKGRFNLSSQMSSTVFGGPVHAKCCIYSRLQGNRLNFVIRNANSPSEKLGIWDSITIFDDINKITPKETPEGEMANVMTKFDPGSRK